MTKNAAIRGFVAGLMMALVCTAFPATASALDSTGTGVKYNGGPVLQPVIIPLYWGNFTQTQINNIQSYLNNLALYISGSTSPQGLAPTVSQYGVRGATLWQGLGAYCISAQFPPTNPTNKAYLVTQIQYGLWGCNPDVPVPQSGAENVVIVFTSGINFTDVSCGYNGSISSGERYAITRTECDWQATSSHEILELSAPWSIIPPGPSGSQIADPAGCGVTPVPWGVVANVADAIQNDACTAWTPEQSSSIAATSQSLTGFGEDQVDVVALKSDHTFVHRESVAGTWNSSWISLPSPSVFNSAPVVVPAIQVGSLDAFGQGTDNALYHATFTQDLFHSGSWQASWDALGGKFNGQPSVVSGGINKIDIFVQGTDGTYYRAAWNGGTWSTLSWIQVGTTVFNGAPKAVVVGANNLYLFGWGIDGTYWVNHWTGSSFGGWSNSAFSGDRYISDPAVVVHGNRIDVFGQGTNYQYYHRALISGSWGALDTSIGGVYVGPPAAAAFVAEAGFSYHSDTVLFGQGTDTQGHYFWSSNDILTTSWSPNAMNTNGGGIGAAALTVSTVNPLIYAFVHGGDNNVWLETEAPGGTTDGSWTQWGSLTGVSLQ